MSKEALGHVLVTLNNLAMAGTPFDAKAENQLLKDMDSLSPEELIALREQLPQNLLANAAKHQLVNLIGKLGEWDSKNNLQFDVIDVLHALRVMGAYELNITSAFNNVIFAMAKAFSHKIPPNISVPKNRKELLDITTKRREIPSNETLDEAYEKYKTTFRQRIAQHPHPDIRRLGMILVDELQPVRDVNDEKQSTHAWRFQTGDAALKNGEATQMNITFLGTGSEPLFANHDFGMREGGDTLCQLALEKSLYAKEPTLLVRGVGTYLKTNSEYPLQALFDTNLPTAGGTGGLGFGTGIDRRIQLALEEFYIPNLLTLINNQIKNNPDGPMQPVQVNIIGHSRGGITTYYMASLIDTWLKHIQQSNISDETIETIAPLYGFEPEDFKAAIHAIKENKIQCATNLLIYDPVEGRFRSGSSALQGEPTIAINNLKGFKGSFNATCAVMPETVKKATIFVAESERRMDFRPTIAEFAPGTQCNVMQQLGTHSTMTGNLGDDTALLGAYAYPTFKVDDPKSAAFAKQIVNAMIDRAVIDARYVLYKDTPPPIPRDILRRILFEDATSLADLVYPITRNYLLNAIPGNEKMTPIELIEAAEQSLQNPTLNSRLHYLLKKDISELFQSKEEEKKSVINNLLLDMKKDTTQSPIGALAVQNPLEDRQIFVRNKQLHKGKVLEIIERYPELKTNHFFDSTPSFLGPMGPHRTIDPFYNEVVDLSTINTADPSFSGLVELNMAYDALCQASMMCLQSGIRDQAAIDILSPYIQRFNQANIVPEHQINASAMALIKLSYQHKNVSTDALKLFFPPAAFAHAQQIIAMRTRAFLIEQHKLEERFINKGKSSQLQKNDNFTLAEAYHECKELIKLFYGEANGKVALRDSIAPTTTAEYVEAIENTAKIIQGAKIYNLILHFQNVKDPNCKSVIDSMSVVALNNLKKGHNVTDMNDLIKLTYAHWMANNKNPDIFLKGIESIEFTALYKQIQQIRINSGLPAQDITSLKAEISVENIIRKWGAEYKDENNPSSAKFKMKTVMNEMHELAKSKRANGESILDLNSLIHEAIDRLYLKGFSTEDLMTGLSEKSPGVVKGLAFGIVIDTRSKFKHLYDEIQGERKKLGLDEQTLDPVKEYAQQAHVPQQPEMRKRAHTIAYQNSVENEAAENAPKANAEVKETRKPPKHTS